MIPRVCSVLTPFVHRHANVGEITSCHIGRGFDATDYDG
jgi:hypothetical protein